MARRTPESAVYFLELGGEDDAFARYEASAAAADVTPLAVGLATATAMNPDRVRGLAYTRRASELLGRSDGSIESACIVLSAASLERQGTVAVRATDVQGTTGVDTMRAERRLGSILVERGFAVDLDDPDHVLRVAFAGVTDDGGAYNEVASDGEAINEVSFAGDGTTDTDQAESDGSPTPSETADDTPTRSALPDENGVCAIGWEVAASVRDFGERAPTEKPFFQPGSMGPLLARAIANVADARPGVTILDPMCGTGGILVEAGLLGADVVASDAQSKMVRGARENLEYFLDPDGQTPSESPPDRSTPLESPPDRSTPLESPPGRYDVARADATALPFGTDAVDAVVVDVPYGRQSKIATHSLTDLVSGTLAESRRVADRAVVVADRPWTAPAREAGWTIDATFERRVHRSLTRHVVVLE